MTCKAIALDQYIKAGNAQGAKTEFDIWLEAHKEWLVSKVGSQECGEVTIRLSDTLLYQVGRLEQKPCFPEFNVSRYKTIEQWVTHCVNRHKRYSPLDEKRQQEKQRRAEREYSRTVVPTHGQGEAVAPDISNPEILLQKREHQSDQARQTDQARQFMESLGKVPEQASKTQQKIGERDRFFGRALLEVLLDEKCPARAAVILSKVRRVLKEKGFDTRPGSPDYFLINDAWKRLKRQFGVPVRHRGSNNGYGSATNPQLGAGNHPGNSSGRVSRRPGPGQRSAGLSRGL